mmetsp:Transcript_15459/g.24060  ORF Transcript_15459/g.24060 Transcript_15459/m.24060 type:complete len:289 (-) Transcript_15459:1517-2383(-)
MSRTQQPLELPTATELTCLLLFLKLTLLLMFLMLLMLFLMLLKLTLLLMPLMLTLLLKLTLLTLLLINTPLLTLLKHTLHLMLSSNPTAQLTIVSTPPPTTRLTVRPPITPRRPMFPRDTTTLPTKLQATRPRMGLTRPPELKLILLTRAPTVLLRTISLMLQAKARAARAARASRGWMVGFKRARTCPSSPELLAEARGALSPLPLQPVGRPPITTFPTTGRQERRSTATLPSTCPTRRPPPAETPAPRTTTAGAMPRGPTTSLPTLRSPIMNCSSLPWSTALRLRS